MIHHKFGFSINNVPLVATEASTLAVEISEIRLFALRNYSKIILY